MRFIGFSVLLLAIAASAPLAAGQATGAGTSPSGTHAWTFDHIPADLLNDDGFLAGHPDLLHRQAGMKRDEQGDWGEARERYRLAARYGDKPSQARLGEMHWNGEGGAVDRAEGFLWMSLAAERGYSLFEDLKLLYWEQLTAAERQRARALDQQMLREYGDAAAKPRQERVMRREFQRSTASRLGYNGQPAYIMRNWARHNGGSIQAERFYARDLWEPEAYWRLQDRIWRERVTVGEIENVDYAAPVEPE